MMEKLIEQQNKYDMSVIKTGDLVHINDLEISGREFESAEIMFITDLNVVFKHGRFEISGSRERFLVSKIDTRTDEEKLIDELIIMIEDLPSEREIAIKLIKAGYRK